MKYFIHAAHLHTTPLFISLSALLKVYFTSYTTYSFKNVPCVSFRVMITTIKIRNQKNQPPQKYIEHPKLPLHFLWQSPFAYPPTTDLIFLSFKCCFC